MSEPPDVVTRLFSVVDSRNWPLLTRVLAENVHYERPGFAPMRGFADVERFYREKRDIASGRHVILGCVNEADESCCWGEFSGISLSDRRIDERFCDWYVFCDGLITVRRTFFYRPAC
ncbi:nuclear transport factor 2 family protein [Streptomyces sp. NPDC002758]